MALSRALVLAAALTSSVAGCATAPPPTPDEAALIEEMTERTIVPASEVAREAAADSDPVAQAAFWAREYENNPADRDAALNYARVSRRMGQPARAASIANQALALRPDDVGLLTELGAALIVDQRAVAAVSPLEYAVSLAPDDARLRNLLGTALDRTGSHDLARRHYQAALDLRGEDATTLTNYAMSYTLTGQAGQAEDLLRRAIRLPGANNLTRQNLALALALQGKFDEAESLAQQDLPREVAEANVQYIREMMGF